MMGGIVNEKQMKKNLDYIKISKSEGCKIVCGGASITDNGLYKGYYIQPTLLLNANNKMRVAQEEIFGPVAVVIRLHDVDEAIAMANDSLYNLGDAAAEAVNKTIKVARGV